MPDPDNPTATITTPLRAHPGLKLVASGKVREVYELNDAPRHLLFVATDRVSAFDRVMANGVPGKGRLLSGMSRWWFEFLRREMPEVRTHFVRMGVPEGLRGVSEGEREELEGRCMVVRRLEVFKIEAIVRGYITGSAFSSYQKHGTVNGRKLPEGLREGSRLDPPLYTPSTKAGPGEHDENIDEDEAAAVVGPEYADQIKALSLAMYRRAADYAMTRGIVLADTKFEFALDKSTSPPSVVLVDEVLTPDSSRFWSLEKYSPGRQQESFDKQALRDWLVQTGQKGKESVVIPPDVIALMQQKYNAIFDMLTGSTLEESR